MGRLLPSPVADPESAPTHSALRRVPPHHSDVQQEFRRLGLHLRRSDQACGKRGKPKAGFPLFQPAPWKSRPKAGTRVFPEAADRSGDQHQMVASGITGNVGEEMVAERELLGVGPVDAMSAWWYWSGVTGCLA